MKDSVFPSNNNRSSEEEEEERPLLPSSINKKPKHITKSALIHLQNFDIPLISRATGSPLGSICLQPDRPYTIGRTYSNCDFIFENRLVSKQHCQILFDSVQRKIYILDGAFLLHGGCIVGEFQQRLLCYDELEGEKKGSVECSRVRVSLNGVFVNGVRVKRGMVKELCAGDEVLLVCGNEDKCSLRVRIGFLIQGVLFKEEVVMGPNGIQLERPRLFESADSMGYSQGSISSGKRTKRVFAIRPNEILAPGCELKCGGIVGRSKFLLSQCRHIIHSDDPISYIRQCDFSEFRMKIAYAFNNKLNYCLDVTPGNTNKAPCGVEMEANTDALVFRQEAQPYENSYIDQDVQNNEEKGDIECGCVGVGHLHKKDIAGIHYESAVANNSFKSSSLNSVIKENLPCFGGVLQMKTKECVVQMKTKENCCLPPGKKFYLNRLHCMEHGSFSHHNVVSLPELLYPIENILRIFIATFTSDILWFLSYCEIPRHLPVTIACHNTERCWSSGPDKRTSVPYSDFPNLVVVFPPFPEAIAFGQDRKRQGIACHHPKLLVLQREDSIRIIITSANLVNNQWNNVTNTVWWQDFPLRDAANLSSLFIQVSDGEVDKDSKSDFAAQLAGFMASLVIDVPSQAHWIIELTKYNFEGAVGHLITSVPGIHSCRPPNAYQFALGSFGVKSVGLVEASVVGLNHLFRTAADRNGSQLKRLAACLGKSFENTYGMLRVVLRRNTNVPADANAVSILVPNPDQFSEGDCSQLGFLPRNVAKWVSPLWDSGFFTFYGYVYPKEALAAALGGSNIRVQLILHVSQGPNFPHMMTMMQAEHVIAFCSLIASIQRCMGLWRLQEVLHQYTWPDLEQSDFIYGSSSIGSSINTQFLAAFSAAAGKRSLEFFDSEESDPEWGCWNASQEQRNPSIRIVFPTIERVKNACNGILPSRRILCFSEKTWQRLRTIDILHDAVPHPCDRVGQPMHVKVAWRRFLSKTDSSSYGWVYCGSHNFSASAWGRPISNPFGVKSNELEKTNSSLGLRLHICNYELGIIFFFPRKETNGIGNEDCANLDDIVLPFVVPAPKYGPTDRPATVWAMREALAELTEQEKQKLVELGSVEEVMEEVPDDEEELVEEATDYVVEKEDEKVYAEMLWSQVDLSQSG